MDEEKVRFLTWRLKCCFKVCETLISVIHERIKYFKHFSDKSIIPSTTDDLIHRNGSK